MQDPDAPPAVVEGETGGDAIVVPEAVAGVVIPQPAISSKAAFTALLWITPTAPH